MKQHIGLDGHRSAFLQLSIHTTRQFKYTVLMENCSVFLQLMKRFALCFVGYLPQSLQINVITFF